MTQPLFAPAHPHPHYFLASPLCCFYLVMSGYSSHYQHNDITSLCRYVLISLVWTRPYSVRNKTCLEHLFQVFKLENLKVNVEVHYNILTVWREWTIVKALTSVHASRLVQLEGLRIWIIKISLSLPSHRVRHSRGYIKAFQFVFGRFTNRS